MWQYLSPMRGRSRDVRAGLALAISAVLASCLDARRQELPPLDGAKALLLLTARGNEPPSLRAVPLEPPLPRGVSFASAEALAPEPAHFVLLYDETLGALGIDPDDWGARPGANGGAIGRPHAVYARAATGGGGLTWERAGALPEAARDALTRLGFELACTPCVSFGAKTIELPTLLDVELAVAIDERSALIATADGRFYRASPTGAEPIELLPPPLPHLAATRTEQGDILLAGGGDAIWRGHPDRLPYTRLATTTSTEPVAWIATSSGGAPLEIYTLSTTGGLHRYDGAAWTLLGRLPALPDGQEATNTSMAA